MKQLIDMIEAVAYEKNMPKDRVHEAMEGAIAALARKENKEPGALFHTEIDKEGNVTCWRVWDIVDNVMDEDRERLPENDEENPGDQVMEQAETPQWTRQGLQVVKQVLAQKLKQGLRQTVADAWKAREGEVVLGTVKRLDKNRVIVDLGEPAEGVLDRLGRIPNENYRIGQRIRSIVHKVNHEGPEPVIELSRTSEDFLREIMAIEIPEIETGQVIIKGIARDPGSRAKVAVEEGPGLRNGKGSAKAACIGMRGIRAQAIMSECGGERIDFIEWTPNTAEFIVMAMEPAVIKSMNLDETTGTATLSIDKDTMARAIGSKGQNVRLASALTGWNINVLSEEDFNTFNEKEVQEAVDQLMTLMDLDEEFALALIDEGFYTLEDIVSSSVDELMNIDGVDEELAETLKDRALDAQLLREALSEREPVLYDLDDITDEDVQELAGQEVHSVQDMADLGLGDIEWADEEQLKAWIMQARRIIGMI